MWHFLASYMYQCRAEMVTWQNSLHMRYSPSLPHSQTICLRTVDTEVVVILAGTFHDLVATQPLADIWVACGMGKNYRFYHINAICESLGNHNREHYLCSAHFPGATQLLPSTARARSRFGRPGRHLKTWQRHSCIWPAIPFSCWMPRTATS